MTAEYTVIEHAEGGFTWLWEMPDGAALMGTADTEDEANADAQRVIRDWYAQAH